MTQVCGVTAGGASACVTESFAAKASALPPRVSFRNVLLGAAATPHLSLGDPLGALDVSPTERSPGRGAGWQPAGGAAAAAVVTPSRRVEMAEEDDRRDSTERRRPVLPAHDLVAPAPFGRGPHVEPVAPRADATDPLRTASLEELFPMLVRRIAWSREGDRAAVRLELGAGELAGGTLLVQSDGGRVRVHLEVPPGVNAGVWCRRISDRLATRGLPVDAVEVA